MEKNSATKILWNINSIKKGFFALFFFVCIHPEAIWYALLYDAKYFCETKSKTSCALYVQAFNPKKTHPRLICWDTYHSFSHSSISFSLAVYFIVFHTIFYYYSCTFSLESDRYAFKSKSERPPNREHKIYTYSIVGVSFPISIQF